MRERLGGASEIGDRLPLGPVELIVRQIDFDGDITEIGLSVEPQTPARLNLVKRAARRLRRLLGWRAMKMP